jgi:hypothetical protein
VVVQQLGSVSASHCLEPIPLIAASIGAAHQNKYAGGRFQETWKLEESIARLNTVAEFRTRARDLYYSQGFRVLKEFPRYRKSPD